MNTGCRFIQFLLFFFVFCAPKEFHYRRFIMGGPCEIKFYCANSSAADKIVAEISKELYQLDSLLNYFSKKSLVSEINKNHRAKLAGDIIYLFFLSDSISKLTDGLFDISVAPLVEIWGFYQGEKRIPSTKEIIKTKNLVNYQRIKLKGDSIIIPENMAIDLGAIAQGFAADQVGKILKKHNITSAIINIGGEITAIGKSPKNHSWRVGIKNPRGEGIIETVALADGALSTSGDYEKFFEINKKRYPHILNPKTGMPALDFASVTIFAKETAYADGMATAVAVMGPNKGKKFLDSLQIRGIIYYEKDGKLKRLATE